MKKLSGIFLLACLSLPLMGTYTYLLFQKLRIKQEVKQAIKEGMSKECLVRLAFSQAEVDGLLNWEHDKEFEFQNQMFDVLEQKKQGDSIIYWCWWDQEETLLNRYLETLAKNAFAQDPKQQEAQDQLFEFLNALFYHTHTELSLFKCIALDAATQDCNRAQVSWYHSWKQRPPSPPPKLV